VSTETKLKQLKNLTNEMATHRKRSAVLSTKRRRLMYELNRNYGVTYLELSEAAGVNAARVAQEMARQIREM